MLVTARVDLEGGLLGPLVYWLRSLVSLPKIMGASDQDRSLFNDLCERGHEGLVGRSGSQREARTTSSVTEGAYRVNGPSCVCRDPSR